MTTPSLRWPRGLAALALVALAVVSVVGTIGAARHQSADRPVDALALLLVLVAPVALVFVRARPVAVLWVVVAATLTYLSIGYAYGPVVIGAAIALFAAVVQGHRGAAWAAFAVLYVGHFAARQWLLDDDVTWGGALGVAAWGLVVMAIADVVRVRRERMAAGRAVHRETARRQANEERLRIARELHDVVAHHMSLINVQAGVALHLVDRRPDQVQTALTVIKDASKEALVELRSLVGVLRDEADEAPRAPTAMLDALDDLVERSALAGLVVRKRVQGEVQPLPAAVELAAFRIVQEAVTNVIRHASARSTEILLGYGADDLVVMVDDDGVGAAGLALDGDPDDSWLTGAGAGLRGMRERATILGGSLTIGTSPAGGMRVRAVLPLGRAS